jgi:NADH:ubiquinone reductase (H+-translocating)
VVKAFGDPVVGLFEGDDPVSTIPREVQGAAPGVHGAQAFGRRFTGLIAYGMWSFIHVMYLVGWGNRLGTMYTWGRALYVAKNRGHRIISFEQAHNRVGEGLHHSGRPAAILPNRRPNRPQ